MDWKEAIKQSKKGTATRKEEDGEYISTYIRRKDGSGCIVVAKKGIDCTISQEISEEVLDTFTDWEPGMQTMEKHKDMKEENQLKKAIELLKEAECPDCMQMGFSDVCGWCATRDKLLAEVESSLGKECEHPLDRRLFRGTDKPLICSKCGKEFESFEEQHKH